jgi:pimeloyl-ACP methyl ester carboxylesterase
LIWTLPEAKAFFDRMSGFCRVLLFDKAGVGLSDPVPNVRSIEERALELEAVMDAAGFEKAVLCGISEGGPASIVFAATHPERVTALVLTGTFAWTPFDSWEDIDADPAMIRDRMQRVVGNDHTPSLEKLRQFQSFAGSVRSAWGTGEALRRLLPSIRSTRQLGMLERMSASPGMARATVEATFHIDVRPVLSTLSLPTLVIHATDDVVPIEGGRYLADHIDGARLLEVAGNDHAPWFSEPTRITNEIEEFLTGSHSAPSQTLRALRSVLFTDIVASTDRAAVLGDERWRAVLERFGEIAGDVTTRFGGQLVKSTGDGHLATFDGPTQAIRCAEALRTGAEALGIEVRAAIHTGECELMGNDIGGIAVHIAARILGNATAGAILVSSAVRDLVVGSGIGFQSRGVHELRGVPGRWELVEVDPLGAQPGSVEAKLVALPTPGARTGMRPSDKAVEVVARRAPWLLRGFAHLAPSGNRS